MRAEDLIELVAVGHVTVDRVGDEDRLGGAASYAVLAARALGVRAALVTSAAATFPFWDRFAGIEVRSLESVHSTTLEHHVVNGKREQRLIHQANAISDADLKGLAVSSDAAVLFCPVIHEIDARIAPVAPRGLVAVAPQGWYRQWDETGAITTREWADADAEETLYRADVVSMSEEDALAPEELAESFPGRAFTITKGSAGCRVYAGADVFDFPAVAATEVDATGAGDVFAVALVIALRRGDALIDAVRFASREAAASVEFVGTEGFS